MQVKFKKLHPDAVIPKKSTELAGGWDVFCTEIIKESDDLYICKLGISMQPENVNYKITLVPRSSLTKTYWILQNSPGLGDPDYTGEYSYRFRGLPIGVKQKNKIELAGIENQYKLLYSKFPYNVGDRIGQIYLEEIIPIEFKEVDDLQQTLRGDGGFGSTGNR